MRELILEKLKANADRIVAAPLSDVIAIRFTSNLFVWQSLFKDLGAAHAELGDARYLEYGLEATRYLYRGGWEQCGLVEEIHHAFVLNGIADFFWRNEAHIPESDARAIRELAGRVGTGLMLDATKQEWGKDIRKRNAWNHTVIGYSGIGVAGFLAPNHPDAESWRRIAIERVGLFFRDGVTDAGMTREGIAYCGFVFRNLSVLLHAARKTGEWDYTQRRDNPHLDRLEKIPLWYATELFPGGSYLQNWNDSYWNPLPALTGFLSMFRDLAPAAVAHVWNRLVGPDGTGSFGVCFRDSSISETVLFPPDLSLLSRFTPPRHFQCNDYGYFAATAGKSGRESKLSFGAGEFIGAIHDQADNNSFMLFLDGLPVIIDAGAANDPKEGTGSSSFGHAAIVIDGKGQFPCGHGGGCSGSITHAHAADDHFVVAGDARRAYAANKYNPVLKALRQCVLALGEQPYLVVFDDICKDESEHSYESLLHTPRLADVHIDVPTGTVRGTLDFEGRHATLVMRVVSPALEDISWSSFHAQPPFVEHDLWKFKLKATAPLLVTLIYLENPGAEPPSCELASRGDRLAVRIKRGASGGVDSFVFDPHATSTPLFSRVTLGAEPSPLSAEGEVRHDLPPPPDKRFFAAASSTIRNVRGRRPGLDRTNPTTTSPDPSLNPVNQMNDSIIVRKAKKLVRSPELFFSESSHPALQRLGGLLKRDPQSPPSQPMPNPSRVSPPPPSPGNGQTSAGSLAMPRQAQVLNTATENTRLAEHADDARKLAGFAAALAATDYPTAGEGVVMGLASYRAIGLEFLRYFIKWGELTPEDDVLDVGCGGGRMAATLAYYLGSGSRYVGFDIHKGSIDWCRDHITTRWPNFHFDHFDIGNSHYNPRGAVTGQSFAFPYDDRSFSFVIATSLFTHLPRQEVKHYLREVARVLRPNGRFFATAYLMTPAAEAASRQNADAVRFSHQFGENPVQSLERPMAAVAQREGVFVADVSEAGLVIDRVAYGWWSGLSTSNGKQDIIVLRKP